MILYGVYYPECNWFVNPECDSIKFYFMIDAMGCFSTSNLNMAFEYREEVQKFLGRFVEVREFES